MILSFSDFNSSGYYWFIKVSVLIEKSKCFLSKFMYNIGDMGRKFTFILKRNFYLKISGRVYDVTFMIKNYLFACFMFQI